MNINVFFHCSIVFAITIQSCNSSHFIQTDGGVLDVVQLGAVPNDGIHDDAAFERAFKLLLRKDYSKLHIPKGEYDLTRRITIIDQSDDISITGENGSTINLHGEGFIFISAKRTEFELNTPIRSGDKTLNFMANGVPAEGNSIHIQSDSPFESGWGYCENDILSIDSINRDNIVLDSSILFNYNPMQEKVRVWIWEMPFIAVKNLEFRVIKGMASGKKLDVLTFQGCRTNLHSLKFVDRTSNPIYNRGVTVSSGINVFFEDLIFENVEYGILLNFCRDVVGKRIRAINCRHAVAPSTATCNVFVSDIHGKNCQGVIDAHVAFNVRYENIKDEDARAFSNIRAIGVVLKNATFDVEPQFYQDYAYWSAQTLLPEYISFYKSSDVLFENVYWVHERPSNYNGLTVYSCRDLIVRNCVTHNISQYGVTFGSIHIENSTLGSLKANTHKIRIFGSTFDGSLFENAPFVFGLTGGGSTVLEEVVVQGYSNNAYLFDRYYNTDNKNDLQLIDSRIEDVKGWTSNVVYPGKVYKSVSIRNSTICKLPEGIDQIFVNDNTRSFFNQSILNIGEQKD